MIVGVYRTLESAKKCAIKELEKICSRSNFNETDKSDFISQLNEDLLVEDLVYIAPETLLD